MLAYPARISDALAVEGHGEQGLAVAALKITGLL
jgi:hypothetical protein